MLTRHLPDRERPTPGRERLLAAGRRPGILRRAARCVVFSAALFLTSCVYLPHGPLPDPATLTAAERAAQNEFIYRATWELVGRGYFSETYQGINWDEAYDRHVDAARAAIDEAGLYAAINALIDELADEHTYALSPDETDAMNREQRVLLGLILRPVNLDEPAGPMLILDTIPGSNAAESGVLPGWVLLSCDGQAPATVLGAGRLREEQTVECRFHDLNDAERTVPLTARRVSTQPLLISRVLDDGVLYLRFDKFDGASARWLREQLKAHRMAPGVVIDLRQNPGGDAAALGRMLGEFFRHRVDMGTFITRRGINDRLRAWRWVTSATYLGPVAILVSANSASSSEIFSAVMQYHDRAEVLGETTAGAVLASRFFPLPGGGRLQLSIDDYVAPDGRRLEGNGVTPDQIITQTAQDLRADRDPALAAARRYLHDKAAAVSTPSP